MPVGLGGNANPIVSARRSAVLERVADEIVDRPRASVLRVAIDGVDGAGKTTLADELAAVLARRGVPVIRATTDSFHNPRSVRWHRGRRSPEGFYLDSHNLDSLTARLLDPLSACPPEPFRTEAFDEPSDSPVDAAIQVPVPGAVLLFDGLFLARPELRRYWDYFIWVDAEQRVADERISLATAECPPGFMAFWHLAGWWAKLERYVAGMRGYIVECRPRSRADAVVDNNDPPNPTVDFRSGDRP